MHDWGRLHKVLGYLKGTKYMKLTLNIHELCMIRWWVDASKKTHHDCKGYAESIMSLGDGTITIVSVIYYCKRIYIAGFI